MADTGIGRKKEGSTDDTVEVAGTDWGGEKAQEYGEFFNATLESDLPAYEVVIEELRAIARRRERPISVVEMGPNAGNLTCEMASMPEVQDILALDINLETLALATKNITNRLDKTNADKIALVKIDPFDANVYELPVNAYKADVVLMTFVIPVIPNVEQIEVLFDRAKSLLKPGGLIVMMHLNEASFYNPGRENLFNYEQPEFQGNINEPGVIYKHTLRIGDKEIILEDHLWHNTFLFNELRKRGFTWQNIPLQVHTPNGRGNTIKNTLKLLKEKTGHDFLEEYGGGEGAALYSLIIAKYEDES